MGKRKPTRDELLAALRSHMVCRTWQPGMPTGDKTTGYFCRLCEGEWKKGRPAKHKPECILS